MSDEVSGWTKLPPPSAVRSETLVQLDDGRILRVVEPQDGGDARSQLFDPATLAWSETGMQRTRARDRSCVTLAEGWVLATGGMGTEVPAGPVAACDMFEPARGAWIEMPPLMVPRYLHAIVCVGGRVMVIGGFVPEPRLGTGMREDPGVFGWAPGEAAWSVLAPLPHVMPGARAIVLANDTVVVWGGAEAVQWMHGRWRTIGAIDPHAAVIETADGRLLAIGGAHVGKHGRSVATWAGGNWSVSRALPRSRKRVSPVWLRDGRLAVFGGTRMRKPGQFSEVAVETMLVREGTTFAERPAPLLRATYAFRLPDGRVLVHDPGATYVWSANG